MPEENINNQQQPESTEQQPQEQDWNQMLLNAINGNENKEPNAIEGNEQTQEQTTEAPATEQQPTEQAAGQTEGTQQQTEVPQEVDWFDITKVNERLGTDFQSEDEIKTYISSLNENKEFLTKKDYYSTLEEEYGKIVDAFNPVKLFGSKEAYESVMLRTNLAKDNLPTVVDSILSTDVKQLDDLDALYLQVVNRSPDLLRHATPDKIKQGLLEDLGVDVSDDDFDISNYRDAFKNNMKGLIALSTKGSQAKGEFIGLINEAYKSIPEVKDFSKEIQVKTQQKLQSQTEQAEKVKKLNEDWNGKVKDLANQFKSIEFKEKASDGKEYVDFTFDVPKEFLDKAKPYLIEYAVKKGFDVSQENTEKLMSELRDVFKEEYQEEIRKAYANDKLSKFKEEMDNRIHNNKPINTQEAPPLQGNTPEDEINAQFRKMYNL